MNFSSSIILITGASSGIGEATAKYLSGQGARMVLMARNGAKLNGLASEIQKAGGSAYPFPVDLSDPVATNKASQQVLAQVGVPDVMINCAGAGNWLSVFETSDEEFHDMMSAPYFATVHVIKNFLPGMVQRGSGHIITINSASAFFSYPGAIGYLSARWALRGFCDALHEELRLTGIRTTQLVAGKVSTPYFSHNPGSESRIPKIATALTKTLTSDQVAREISGIIRSPRKTIIIPRMMAIFVYFNNFFPGVFRLLMRRTGYQGIAQELRQITESTSTKGQ